MFGLLFLFVVATFLGVELINKVPPMLHTPLMSGCNAISGITVLGAVESVRQGQHWLGLILGFLALGFAMVNVAGGYLVTDRMMAMFKKKG
jgi:NAD(P) transhydrogenase subunit alpha